MSETLIFFGKHEHMILTLRFRDALAGGVGVFKSLVPPSLISFSLSTHSHASKRHKMRKHAWIARMFLPSFPSPEMRGTPLMFCVLGCAGFGGGCLRWRSCLWCAGSWPLVHDRRHWCLESTCSSLRKKLEQSYMSSQFRAIGVAWRGVAWLGLCPGSSSRRV